MKPISTNDSRLYGLIALYDMQTDYFFSVLEGISDTDAHNRLGTKANHVAWLAGSLVHQRYDLAAALTGETIKHAADELFKDNQGIKDDVTYPPLEQYKLDWEKIRLPLRNALTEADAEKLDSLFKMPGMEFPYYELVSFCIYREANCIGQIALWRRLLGYEAMKYM